ncbi:glycoside hydrolase family 43 protein [Altererythrobacter sp.]|uniref:glycoside hydrolase family 43 protein n=1 Tax=Altererythrobacter sp. TaxID=1872480 RepID=UPI003D0782CF
MRLVTASLLAIAALAPLKAQAGPSAEFDFLEYRAQDRVAPLKDGEYANPILPGFQPDPSIVKVGEDFYLVNSTFSWFPGLPIYHSRDLVHWRQIGNAIDRPGQIELTGLGTNRGLFAPSIFHHDGRFWIVNTCIECRGNFVITAEDPAGPWSDPIWLDFGGIDPSLYFGEDGKAWIVYNDAPPGEPLYDGHRALWMKRFDPEAMAVIGEAILLVNGGVDLSTKPVWAEGPHIYRVGDWYYLMAAEGGTAEQHSETIYRSRSVEGPYEPGPYNPILTQRDLPSDRPDRVEATGHADLVRLDDGSWWGVFLATRPFAGQSTLLGRESFLLPVSWHDGWPRFLDHGEPVPLAGKRPGLPQSKGDDWLAWRDDFAETGLGAQWLRLRTPGPVQQWALGDGRLQLAASSDSAGSLGHPAFVGRRLRHHEADFTTRLTFVPSSEGDFAGLLAFMDETHFLAFGKEKGKLVARLRASPDQTERGEIVAQQDLDRKGPIDLKLSLRGGTARLAWRAAGTTGWQQLGKDIDVEPLSTIHAGLFTGLVVGPYVYSPE